MNMRPNQTDVRTAPGPWSPVAITVLTFLMPPGGAVLTVWNLQRFGTIDASTARRLMVAVALIFAFGFAVLASIAHVSPGRPPFDSSVAEILSFGTTVAVYGAQREPFRQWRAGQKSQRMASVLSAVWVALLYTFAVSFLATLLYFLAKGMSAALGVTL